MLSGMGGKTFKRDLVRLIIDAVRQTSLRVALRTAIGSDPIETSIHAATSKATPADADEIPLIDSAASWVLKKLTVANIKATFKTYFDTLYQNKIPSQSGKAGASLVSDGTSELWGSGISLATAVASTSGTAIDFTGIPSWAKRVVVFYNGFSTGGTSVPIIQLLVGGAPETTGYAGSGGTIAASSSGANYTTGFGITAANAATSVYHGKVYVDLFSGNTWIADGRIGRSDAAFAHIMGGSKTLAGQLNGVRITTVNGTDTLDLGSVNVGWE